MIQIDQDLDKIITSQAQGDSIWAEYVKGNKNIATQVQDNKNTTVKVSQTQLQTFLQNYMHKDTLNDFTYFQFQPQNKTQSEFNDKDFSKVGWWNAPDSYNDLVTDLKTMQQFMSALHPGNVEPQEQSKFGKKTDQYFQRNEVRVDKLKKVLDKYSTWTAVPESAKNELRPQEELFLYNVKIQGKLKQQGKLGEIVPLGADANKIEVDQIVILDENTKMGRDFLKTAQLYAGLIGYESPIDTTGFGAKLTGMQSEIDSLKNLPAIIDTVKDTTYVNVNAKNLAIGAGAMFANGQILPMLSLTYMVNDAFGIEGFYVNNLGSIKTSSKDFHTPISEREYDSGIKEYIFQEGKVKSYIKDVFGGQLLWQPNLQSIIGKDFKASFGAGPAYVRREEEFENVSNVRVQEFPSGRTKQFPDGIDKKNIDKNFVGLSATAGLRYDFIEFDARAIIGKENLWGARAKIYFNK